MSGFRAKSSAFIQVKVLELMRNCIGNHSGPVANNYFFLPIASLMTQIETQRMVKKNFSSKKLLYMEKHAPYRHRIDWDDENYEILKCLWESTTCRRRLAELLIEKIDVRLRRYANRSLDRDPVKLRLDELQKTFCLSDLEREILLVAFFVENEFLHLNKEYGRRNNQNDRIALIAKCLDRPLSKVTRALQASEKLRRYRCLDAELVFNKELNGFLYGLGSAPLASSYYRQNSEKTLPWSFYGALAERHGELLRLLLSTRHPKRGVNVLLYGAPGTGKTSFAHSLAAELGLTCYDVAQDTHGSGDATRSNPMHRFAALQICDAQVNPVNSLLVVDEADDMLRSRSGYELSSFLSSGSGVMGDKGMLNSVLDCVRTPCFWITNTDADSLDTSSRRRFDYSIRFEQLNASQRTAIWRNNVKQLKLSRLISAPLIEKLAEKYETSAGGITQVLQNVTDMKPSLDTCEALIDQLMKPHCELLGIRTDQTFSVAKDYSLEGLTIDGDIPLEKIVGAVRSFQTHRSHDADRPRMNLLLSGPPGSGKTEFVKYLGGVLKTKVIVKTGSDILSMWVGGTEKNIKKAFEEAASEQAILFIDEIDGLMQTRERAQRAWEVTQVNELLQRMENFDGVMIAATNLYQNLDTASVRRFTFKLNFDYLNRDGKVVFFEKMFRSCLTASEVQALDRICDLTPGDFRTVRQSLYYLGDTVTNVERLNRLRAESKAKALGRGTQIGFGLGGV